MRHARHPHLVCGRAADDDWGRFNDVFNLAVGMTLAKVDMASASQLKAAIENAKAVLPAGRRPIDSDAPGDVRVSNHPLGT